MEPFLLDMALKGAVVLALTGAFAAMARSASASLRHLVWSIGLAAALALPLLQWLLPEWGLAILPATAARFDSAPVAAAAPGPSGGLAILWLMGSVATLVAFLVGRARVRWIARRAAPVDHGPWAALLLQVSGEIGLSRRVRLLQTRGSAMPMMWGVFRPTILIPREADGWSPALRREVILHELAHVQRHDYLTQMIARLACALHWFDPLAWLAARRMRLERERACDDRVIDGGSSPCDYAEHLLAVARWSSTGVRSGALGIAGGSPLGDRLRAVLEAGRSRRRVTPWAALGQTAAAVLLVVPLAALHPVSTPGPADAADPWEVRVQGAHILRCVRQLSQRLLDLVEAESRLRLADEPSSIAAAGHPVRHRTREAEELLHCLLAVSDLEASKGMNIIIEELSIVTLRVSDQLGPYVIGYGGQLMEQVGGKLVPVIKEGIEVFVHVVH